MGITGNCAKFLLYAKQQGVSYSSMIMLGRQQMLLNSQESERLATELGVQIDDIKKIEYAEPFFERLGASVVASVDHSQFEGATVIHDLNKPLPENLASKFSAVFDGGTLEHVFNFPQAIKNCMDMLEIGGHFISITPANNFCGHGFYQFSPELFFSLFSEEHGFKTKVVAVSVELPGVPNATWYKIKNPREVKQRVVLTNSNPTTLMVVAEKLKDTKDIQLTPFQSDYAYVWAVHDSISAGKKIESESPWVHYYRKITPEFIKRFVRNVINRKLNQIENIEGLGIVNPNFFTKIEH